MVWTCAEERQDDVGDGLTKQEGKRKTSVDICGCWMVGITVEEVGNRVRWRKMICCGDYWREELKQKEQKN